MHIAHGDGQDTASHSSLKTIEHARSRDVPGPDYRTPSDMISADMIGIWIYPLFQTPRSTCNILLPVAGHTYGRPSDCASGGRLRFIIRRAAHPRRRRWIAHFAYWL